MIFPAIKFSTASSSRATQESSLLEKSDPLQLAYPCDIE